MERIDFIMNKVSKGFICMDADRNILSCNRVGKEILGLSFFSEECHEAGKLKQGDIVIFADDDLGYDDGNLGLSELRDLNIFEKDLHQRDMLIAIGTFKDKKYPAVYKFFGERRIRTRVMLKEEYRGYQITVIIDPGSGSMEIGIEGSGTYSLNYMLSIGHMVVISGDTGKVKFFQKKGYTARKEGIGELLRGESFLAKKHGENEMRVCGRNLSEILSAEQFFSDMQEIVSCRKEEIAGRVYDINGQLLMCSLFQRKEAGRKILYWIFEDTASFEKTLENREKVLALVEKKNLEYVLKAETARVPISYIGTGNHYREVIFLADRAAGTTANVLITGDSGTGKSHLAREIHKMGRPDKPFVEVNCSSIAPNLFESELFGYVGGSFTGALSSGKIGYFEQAQGGTVFLDEIGELPLDMQVKLLSVLQNKTIYRVGSTRPIPVDIRIIAATNQDLQDMIAAKKFRQDLYYRLNAYPIRIPPLRDRKEDLPLLASSFVKRYCRKYNLEEKTLAAEAIRKIQAYDWPGNIRELENVIERGVMLCDSHRLFAEHINIRADAYGGVSYKEQMRREERRILKDAILKAGGNKEKAMKMLDMSKSAFYRRCRELDLDGADKM